MEVEKREIKARLGDFKHKILSNVKTELIYQKANYRDMFKPFESSAMDLTYNHHTSKDAESSYQIVNNYITKNNEAISKIMKLKSIETPSFEFKANHDLLLILMNKENNSDNFRFNKNFFLKNRNKCFIIFNMM